MMLQEAKKDERYTYIENKTTYSPTVLTGNWVTSRWEHLPHGSSGIVPGVPKDTSCERHVTTSQDAYSLKDFEYGEVRRNYMETQVDKFSNFLLQRANIQCMDGEKYKNNYTSLNALMYELWPKLSQEQSAGKHHNEGKSHKLDTLDSFGSFSSIKRPIVRKPKCPVPTSYKAQFLGHWALSPAESAKQKDMIERLA